MKTIVIIFILLSSCAHTQQQSISNKCYNPNLKNVTSYPTFVNCYTARGIGLATQSVWKRHYLNTVIVYNRTMTKAKVKPMDPQWYNKKVRAVLVNSGSTMSYISAKSGNKYASKQRVLWFFNPTNTYYRDRY